MWPTSLQPAVPTMTAMAAANAPTLHRIENRGYRVIARLHYDDAAHSVHRGATLVFHNATAQNWAVARADSTANDFKYDVEYVMTDGSHRELKDQAGVLQGGMSDYLALPAVPVA